MSISSARRALWRVMALASAALLTGACFDEWNPAGASRNFVYDEVDDMFTMSRDHIERRTSAFKVDIYVFPNLEKYPDFFDSSMDMAPGIEGTFYGPQGPGDADWHQLTIQPDATLGPLFMRGYEKDEPNYHGYFQLRPFHIHVGPTYPKVGAAQPTWGAAGSTVEVEIPASDVDEPITIHPANPMITATTRSYVDGKIRATLEIHQFAKTGDTSLVVQTGLGNRSVPVVFTVYRRAEGSEPARPVISGVFPNYAQADETAGFLIGGSGFFSGVDVIQDGVPQNIDTGGLDSHFFRAFLHMPPHPVSPRVEVVADSLGTSDPAEIRIVPPGTEGPTVERIERVKFVAGTRVQLKITGTNLFADRDAGETIDPVGVGSDATSLPFVRVLQGTLPHSDFAIVEMGSDQRDPGFVTPPAGQVHLALRRSRDGLVSNAEHLWISEPPAAPTPVVRYCEKGRVAQGQDVDETIYGYRLHHAVRVFVESGGVSRVGDFTVDPGGNFVKVRLRADPEAPLTGDVATNLVLETYDGGLSNALSYEILPGAGPSGCGQTPESGIDVTLSGQGRAQVRLSQPTSLPTLPAANFFTLFSAERHPDNRPMWYLEIGVPLLASVQAGQPALVSIKFADVPPLVGIPRYWRKLDTMVPTAASSTDPSALGFCLDGISLLAQENPPVVQLAGYVWVTR